MYDTATTDGTVPKSQSSSRTTNENDYKQFRDDRRESGAIMLLSIWYTTI